MRFFLKLKYDGTSFHGWQKLKNFPTVQATIEAALLKILRRKILIHGCGRTDSGVHAQIYYAHVDLGEDESKNLAYRLNNVLPSSILILDIFKTADHAHAQRDAIERTYQYRIHLRKNPFLFKYSYWYPDQIDVSRLKNATRFIIEATDFSAFTKTPNRQNTTTSEVRKVEWKLVEQNEWHLEISANHFVRGMIRILVAQLLEVASGRSTIENFRDSLLSGKKPIHFKMAPPHGLHLINVKYPFL